MDHTNIYENGTGNQFTLSNININAWQIKRRKKCGGEGEGNDFVMCLGDLSDMQITMGCIVPD